MQFVNASIVQDTYAETSLSPNLEQDEEDEEEEGEGDEEIANEQQPIDQKDAATALQLLGLAQPSKDDEEEQDKKKTAWTAQEDTLLVDGIKKYGYGKWKEIATMIPGRKGKQIKQRWDNTLAAKYIDQENSALLDDFTQKIVEKANLLSHVLQQKTSSSFAPHKPSNIITTLPTSSPPDTKGKGVDEPGTSGTPDIKAETNNLLQSLTDPSSCPSSGLNFADAAALAIYTQHLAQQSTSSSPSSTPNNSYFLPNPFDNTSTDVSAAVAAVVAAVQQQQQQQQQSSPPSHKKTPVKRRRSDPALADTQSDAMTIYASSTPITTNNQAVYPCLFPNCNKTFVRLYNLKSHSRTHTDDRPFICRVCNVAFSRNHDLKRHSKIHEGTKPYQCNGCQKNFSR